MKLTEEKNNMCKTIEEYVQANHNQILDRIMEEGREMQEALKTFDNSLTLIDALTVSKHTEAFYQVHEHLMSVMDIINTTMKPYFDEWHGTPANTLIDGLDDLIRTMTGSSAG